ncbi:hypothetical protein NEMBOFW57_008828 [Staphylotrichum longicolle]|uniref:Homeobox and C2H2 transcription factor n=1 Tax=Staphylotrichum longicolle TaxID=669026 RepID=A0AAD4HW63_9PEZI|nr:hypothetical protein NEMBOFW57_008828 [Staphylotrichum longicolle]
MADPSSDFSADQAPLSLDDIDWTLWLSSDHLDAVSDFADPVAAVAAVTCETTLQSQEEWGSLEILLSEPCERGRLPEATDLTSTPIYAPEDFVNISRWLDGAYHPPVPCTYCQQHRLQCLTLRTTAANPNPVTSCSSCAALFRECSLSRGEKRNAAGFETVVPVFNHLHGVAEWTEEDLISGVYAPQQSESQEGQTQSPHFTEMAEEDGQPKRRFSRKAAKVLRDWLYQNQHDPYPTDEQKAVFAQQTGLTEKQISTWFANARRRSRMARRTSRPGQIFRSGSPMPIARSAPLTPMERWQRSPPDQEPVSESAIQRAIAAGGTGKPWNQPVTSADTSPSPHHLASSVSSIDNNPYQCTFCLDSFKKKHDWVRHEKSVHLSLESWICNVGSAILDTAGGESLPCDFCNVSPLTASHFSDHEFETCADRPLLERSFRRKDHLIQHLRKFHHCTTIPAFRVEACRVVTNEIQSRCGFCQLVMTTWAARADHLAEHFKNGQHMADWSGDWGFDPLYKAMVRNAISPEERSANSKGIS